MYTNEITKALATLAELMQTQEDTYIENGGEITEETEAREEDINALKVLLTTEGADELGRRIAAKQDEVDRYKAEVKAALATKETTRLKKAVAELDDLTEPLAARILEKLHTRYGRVFTI